MNKKFYLFLIVLVFSITYIPDILSTIFQKRILIDHINRPLLKLVLIFGIGIMESTLIKRQIPGIIGWILVAFLFVGFQLKILHWPGANETMLISIFFLELILILFAIIEKNKNFFHYCLFTYIGMKTLFAIIPQSEAKWWIDILFGTFVSIYGIYYLLKYSKLNGT